MIDETTAFELDGDDGGKGTRAEEVIGGRQVELGRTESESREGFERSVEFLVALSRRSIGEESTVESEMKKGYRVEYWGVGKDVEGSV
jgi:hypothetical protein